LYKSTSRRGWWKRGRSIFGLEIRYNVRLGRLGKSYDAENDFVIWVVVFDNFRHLCLLRELLSIRKKEVGLTREISAGLRGSNG
jgi:hypothetical protein